jgi:hypothetical protein
VVWFQVPIGGFAAAIFFFLVHLRPAETELRPIVQKIKGLDATGLTLFAAAMIMLLLALNWGGTAYPWNSSTIIGLLVGSGIAFGLFVPWQLYMKDDALVPPRLFTAHRNVALICLSAFFVNGPFQLVIYWLPIWFQAVLGVSPTQSGIDYFPTVISDVLAALLGSGIVMSLGYWNPFLLFAEVMVCLGGGLLSTLYPTISAGHWIGYQIFGGIGYSLVTNMVCPNLHEPHILCDCRLGKSLSQNFPFLIRYGVRKYSPWHIADDYTLTRPIWGCKLLCQKT